jgi:hypothetical protein
MQNKITERDIYNGIINGTIDGDVLVEFAEKKLAQLDHRNEKAKERSAAKREAGDALTERVYGLLGSEPKSREQVLDELIAAGDVDENELTLGKVGYKLSSLVRDGRAVKSESSVAGEDGKNRRIVVYSLA